MANKTNSIRNMATRNDVTEIKVKLDNIIDWLRSLDNKIKIQNGRVGKSETELAVIHERLKTLNEVTNGHINYEREERKGIEGWDRKKLIFYGGVAIAFITTGVNIMASVVIKMIFGGN